MFEEQFTQFEPSEGCVNLVGAPVVVDVADLAGVHLAATNLSKDFGSVKGSDPSPFIAVKDDAELDSLASKHGARTAIIVGSIASSFILQDLESRGQLDVSSIRGKWETFSTTVVDKPFPGLDAALVIAGSGKRGAIFGAYTLSEQIGVSPWYWWADVPPKHHQAIYATRKTTVHGEPSIRYRGIFLNDEAPALTGWVREKFGAYNSEFYKKVFELLLRLKANFLWPAMWPGYPNPGASFFTDDPETQSLANAYGIMVSTSHHEPMQRLSNEWFADNPDGSWNWLTNRDKITEFFTQGAERAKGHESYFTLGMRGEYDKKMKTDDPAGVVRDVIEVQRKVIGDVYGSEDAVPQLLAIYKEVETYFDSGRLNVPDDVTLLFQDDNFGTIRRLPSSTEAKRKGGAGVYYHFQYVGWPRSYKWTNSASLGKAWHQLTQAYEHNARQIWVFNVGDLKPLEVPITFAMALAWNVKEFGPDGSGLATFFQEMAKREFGPELAPDVGRIWLEYDRLVSLRKHEHIDPGTFSLLHYNEANTIISRWTKLLSLAESLEPKVSPAGKPSFFELVLRPVKASYIYLLLQHTRTLNTHFARQRRNSTNTLAQRALQLFDDDFSLAEEYHALLGGKWNHMMRQPHYGYEWTTWHAPSRDAMTGLSFVQRRQNSNPIVGQMGVAVEGHKGVRPGLINEESERTHPSRRDLVPGLTMMVASRYDQSNRWFEVFSRGTPTIHWSAETQHGWMSLSVTAGTLVPGEDDARVEVLIDWDQVPDDFNEETIIAVRSEEGDLEHVHLPVTGRRVPSTFTKGFVEASGYVSMPATSCDLKPGYTVLPYTGRLETGSISLQPSLKDTSAVEYLEFPFYTFPPAPAGPTRPVGYDTYLILQFGMTLDLSPEDVLSYDIQVDDSPPSHYQMHVPTDESKAKTAEHGWPNAHGWFAAASDNVWLRWHEETSLAPGEHVLRIKLGHPNMLLEKMVLERGPLGKSYLGPPPSFHITP